MKKQRDLWGNGAVELNWSTSFAGSSEKSSHHPISSLLSLECKMTAVDFLGMERVLSLLTVSALGFTQHFCSLTFQIILQHQVNIQNKQHSAG
jgi:hypothetical protein